MSDWVLVPRKLTSEMADAMGYTDAGTEDSWSRAIEAASKPPREIPGVFLLTYPNGSHALLMHRGPDSYELRECKIELLSILRV